MKGKTIRRGLAALLCMAMLLTIPALAIFEEDEIQEIPVVSETDIVAELPEVPVEASSDDDPFGEQAQPLAATVFSVTVPTTVAIHMDASGGITCGNITITNNSSAAVLIKDTQVSALNGWTLMDYATTTFTEANKGQHKVALQLSAVDGAISANGGSKTIGVAAKLPYQGVKITNAAIAQLAFVLGWTEVKLSGLSVTGEECVAVESTIQLSAKKLPINTTDTGPISWNSSNTSVATVSSNGLVTGKKVGEVKITASCGGVTATKTISVIAQPPQIENDGKIYTTTLHEGGVYSVTFTAPCSVSSYRDSVTHIAPVYGMKNMAWRITSKIPNTTKTFIGYGIENDKWEVYSSDYNINKDPTYFCVGSYATEATITFEAIPLSIEGPETILLRSTNNKLTLSGILEGAESQITWFSDDASTISVSDDGALAAHNTGLTKIGASYNGFTVKRNTYSVGSTWTLPDNYSTSIQLLGPTVANCTGGRYATCSGSGTYITGMFGGFDGANGTHTISLPSDIPLSAIEEVRVGYTYFTYQGNYTWSYEGYLSGGSNINVDIKLFS